ncbi:MAG: hypothetical protein A2168_02390 [Planctomycetes bacterium RBG_13_50_24]|nr:MAG: hypothetical protein A2168_02390 [Planctomycetes bacterium RBG_13_50_24]
MARASRPRIENKARMASPQTAIWMRLPLDRIDEKRVAASKPVLSEVEGSQALGMAANAIARRNTYYAGWTLSAFVFRNC